MIDQRMSKRRVYGDTNLEVAGQEAKDETHASETTVGSTRGLRNTPALGISTHREKDVAADTDKVAKEGTA